MNIRSLLASGLILASLSSNAQSNRAYAITGDGNNDFVWMNIREVDLGSGQVAKTIFQHNKSNFILTDIITKKSIEQTATSQGNVRVSRDYPTSSMVAAAAYDKNSNRLYFIPMRLGELRWVDLSSKSENTQFYTLQSDVLKQAEKDESENITRMVIAADGNGYAITNDGNHLIRFTTGKKPVITDLGNLIDAESNKGLSIHNRCSSWGGDMIGDAFGKLYVISANHQVYSVDIETRIATHMGDIKGLPAAYTTNGAAVNADGEIILASATKFDGYYKVKLSDLNAVKVEGSDIKYNASDLAGSNLLLQKEADAKSKFSMADSKLTPLSTVSETKVFPNPITTSTFNVLFDGKKEGMYTIVLTDLAGRTLQSKVVSITKGVQTENVNLATRPAKGMYMVKVIDENKQTVMTEKVMIQ